MQVSKTYDEVLALLKKTDEQMTAYMAWLKRVNEAAALGPLGQPFEELPEEKEHVMRA